MPTYESAAEYKDSAIKLTLGELWWALPWLTLALALLIIRGPGASYFSLRDPFANPVFHPVFPAIWTVAIFIRWRRLRKVDPMELWRKDCEISGTTENGTLDGPWAFAAGLHALANDPQQAVTNFRRALDVTPDDEVYRHALAVALAMTDRPGEALSILGPEPFTWRDPMPAPFRFVRMQSLTALHLIPDAQHAARLNLPFVENESELAMLQELIEQEPPSISREEIAAHWFSAGRQAQLADRTDEAIELFRRAVYAEPRNATYLGALAMSLALAGASEQSERMQKESMDFFARSLAIAPDPLVRFNHVQALHMFGRLDEALKAAFDLLTITPKDPLLLQVVDDITRRMKRPAGQRERGASSSSVRSSHSPSK